MRKNDDLISRQAAIDALKNALNSWSHMAGWRDEEIVKALMQVPAAQPDIHSYKQGVIEGRVQMRTELLKKIKTIVGDQLWNMI